MIKYKQNIIKFKQASFRPLIRVLKSETVFVSLTLFLPGCVGCVCYLKRHHIGNILIIIADTVEILGTLK